VGPSRSPEYVWTPSAEPSMSPSVERGWWTGDWGDPHILTFDALEYDCQAAGEFCMLTSQQTPAFSVQERFTAVGGTCAQASVSTGAALQDAGIASVQLSTPREVGATAMNSVNTGSTVCPIDFYHGGVLKTLTDDLQDSDIDVSVMGPTIRVTHVQSDLHIEVTVQHSHNFGCHFLTQVYLPIGYRQGETLMGLLGTPNGSISDDWRSSDGTVLTIPTTVEDKMYQNAYDYCTTNWCIRNSSDSLFNYSRTGTFDNISACDDPYAGTMQNAVAGASQALTAVCGTNLSCLVDGVCGDINDARRSLANQQQLQQTQSQGNRVVPTNPPTNSPTDSPVLPNITKKGVKAKKAPKAKAAKAGTKKGKKMR